MTNVLTSDGQPLTTSFLNWGERTGAPLHLLCFELRQLCFELCLLCFESFTWYGVKCHVIANISNKCTCIVPNVKTYSLKICLFLVLNFCETLPHQISLVTAPPAPVIQFKHWTTFNKLLQTCYKPTYRKAVKCLITRPIYKNASSTIASTNRVTL